MNIFALSGFINGIAALIFGGFVYLKNRKKLENKLFVLLNLAIAIWAINYGFWQMAIDKTIALFFIRLLMVGAIFIPVSLLHFILKFLGLDQKKKRILILNYLIALFLFIFNFTPLIVRNVRSILYFPFWPEGGILFHFFIFWFFTTIIYVIYLLIGSFYKSKGYKREQIKYLILASVIGLGGGVTNYPLWYGVLLPPYGNFLVFLYPFILFYAITHYRLMNIRVVVGRAAIYLFSFLSVIGISFSLIFLNNRLVHPISFNVLGPLIIIIAVLLFQFFFRFFEKLASRYFYYTFYSYQKVLTDLGEKLTQILDLKKLGSLIVDTLIKTMQLDRSVVLTREESGHYAILRNIGFKEENGISLVKDNFLTKYLEKTKKPLVYEELSLIQRDSVFKEEKKSLSKLQENMKRIEANLCLPLFREDKIIGIIVLGKKISGDPYSQEDLELLTALSAQASVALNNAQLYAKVQDLSQNLQEKIGQQTKELKEAYQKVNKAYQIEKKAHQELKKLDEAKDQFIMATQHHMRTPLAIMKGYVSMLLEGDYGKINKEARKRLVFLQQSIEKLITLVNEFLDISQFRVGKGVLNLKEVKIEDLIREIIKELKWEAENKGLYIKMKKLKISPVVKADRSKLKEAIYNIIAVSYTHLTLPTICSV